MKTPWTGKKPTTGELSIRAHPCPTATPCGKPSRSNRPPSPRNLPSTATFPRTLSPRLMLSAIHPIAHRPWSEPPRSSRISSTATTSNRLRCSRTPQEQIPTVTTFRPCPTRTPSQTTSPRSNSEFKNSSLAAFTIRSLGKFSHKFFFFSYSEKKRSIAFRFESISKKS